MSASAWPDVVDRLLSDPEPARVYGYRGARRLPAFFYNTAAIVAMARDRWGA